MNNPREFCRLPNAHTAILLTYNFDALFFERIVLNDLWAGETGDVLVVADPGQVAAAAEGWGGQLKHLGRRYQLIQASATTGAFHPKIFLRLGQEGGYVWLGSGNLTHGGWGGNREMCAAWEIGPGRADTGVWVAGLLGRISEWSPANLSHDVARRASEIQWIREASGVSAAPSNRALVTSFGGESLAALLSERWRGRRFSRARIITGSTDDGGAQLRWLGETFGVEHATVVLDQHRASFRQELLNRLPLEARVMHLPGRPVHAKFYWLDGPDGPAAVFGSANCSATAWLRPPDSGGNVEAVVVYDQPEPADFAPVLEAFDSEELVAAELGQARVTDDRPTATAPALSVSEVVWDDGLSEIRVMFAGTAAVEEATIIATGEVIPMRPVGQGREVWAAELTRPFGEGETAFVIVEVRSGGGSASRLRCWVNQLSELRHASRGRRIADRLGALVSGQPPGEQQRIVDDLHRIGIALLTEADSFPDPPAVRLAGDEASPSAAREWVAVKPEEFVVSIEDLRHERAGRGTDTGLPALSLSGVLRALFAAARPTEADDEATFANEPGQDDSDEEPDAGATVKPPAAGAHLRAPTAHNTARLRKNMAEFLSKMTASDFAAECTATQLVQASAYPLAVATLGRRGKWVDDETALAWVRQVSDLLFTKRYGGTSLLAAVRERYRLEGREPDFIKVVGDGTLWLALLASLGGGAWAGRNSGFERAFALSAVFGARELIASGDPGRLGVLLDRLGERQVRTVLAEAPGAVRLLHDVEEYLKSRWDDLIKAQAAARPFQRTGDLSWHPKPGWAEVLEDKEWGGNFKAYLRSKASEINASSGFYLNVTRAAERDEILRAKVAEFDLHHA